MDSYLSGDSRNIRIPNVSSWVIWGAVKKSGSEILIKEEKWQHIDPYISIFWALPINHYSFYSLYALWGFLILSHTTKISPSEKGCWALDRNSMWGIVQLLNSKIGTFLEKKWASDMARGRALDEGAIPCGWLFGFSFSFSLVRLLNIRQDNYTVLYFMRDTFQASQWLASAQDGTSWSSL